MNCCYTDDLVDECANRRIELLPMCAKHMRYTFRLALVEGLLPADVFKVIAAEAVEALGIGLKRRRIDEQVWLAQHKLREAEEAARLKEDPIGTVYYVQLTGGRVKIGWTKDMPTRMAAFRARSEDVLATEPGPRSLETERHRQFKANRLGRTEEFEHSAQLARHIARLAGQVA